MPTKAGSPKTQHHREQASFRRLARLLARRVRQLRQDRAWTIEVAAERFHVEPAHVRRIEGGTANPSLAVLTSVARGLGMTVAELLADEGRR